MKIGQRSLDKLTVFVIVLVTALGLTILLPQVMSVSQEPTNDVELIKFSSRLILDGKEHTIVDGKLVPAADIRMKDSMFPPSGVHTFTSSQPSWNFGDANGTGAEQIRYSTGYEQWGYKLTPALRSIIVGNVQQAADLYHYSTRKSYGTHNVPPDYQFHGSMPRIEARGTYSTTFRATFRHNLGGGGNGVLSAQWNWQRR